MCKKTWEKMLKTLKESECFSVFNVLVLPILCFLSAMTAFNGVKNYLRFDVVSQTRVIEKIPLIFPTVTFCHLNTFATEEASKLARKIIETELETNIDDSTISSSDYLTLIEIANAILLSYVNNPSFGDSNRKALGFDLNEILHKCEFNKVKCNPEDFEW
jgi:hypothetical protein